MRVALVHDFLLDLRGGERVFLQLCDMWPEADVFTAVYDAEGTEGRFAHRNVHTSFLQKVRPSARNFRLLFPLYPTAIESFDLSQYDLVISSSSAWAHGVLCPEDTLHVSYCHNPFRYAWNEMPQTLASRNFLSRKLLHEAFSRWRNWDYTAARRTDRYISNSRITQQRLRRYFERSSNIVYPPVDTARFAPRPVGEHFVTLSELMSHKQLHVAIEAFNRLGRPLYVIGDGPEASALRRLAGPTVHFTGRISDTEVADLLGSAQALILTAVEEFGIAAVESQAAGRPVIARRGGGALETVEDGLTGTFWSGGPDELADVVRDFDPARYSSKDCVDNASRFDITSFRSGIRREVDAARNHPDRVERDREPLGDRQPLGFTKLIALSGASSRR